MQDQPQRYRYLITLKSTGQSHLIKEPQTEEELHRWIGTGSAGILYPTGPIVRFIPDDIAKIEPVTE